MPNLSAVRRVGHAAAPVDAARSQVTAGPSLLRLGRASGRLHVADVFSGLWMVRVERKTELTP